MRTSKLVRPAALALSLCCLVTTAGASDRATLVEGGGRVFSVLSGSLGELFPGDESCSARDGVLALDLVGVDGSSRRELVPGTCNSELEAEPSLVYDEASEALYLLYQSKAASGSSRIFLASYRNGSWAEALEVTQEPAVLRGGPRLLTTRDEISFAGADGGEARADRRILHVAWTEGEGSSPGLPRYAPIILVDGEFVGRIPIIALEELPAGSLGSPAEPAADSVELSQPELVPGVDEKSVVVGFVHPDRQRLVTVEIRQLPAILSSVAADASRLIEEIGSSLLNQPGGIESLAEQVGQRIVETGYGLHISIRAFLAAKVEQVILEESLESAGPGIPLDALAGTVGARTVEFGSRVFGIDGLERIYEDDRLSVIAFSGTGNDETGAASAQGPQHLLRFYAVSNRPTPNLEGQTVTFLSSRSGENALLCWQESASEVRYQESSGEGWGPVRALPLSEDLGYEQIQRILRERVQER
ncbi:MAG: hypothetical protein KDD47_16195 [Acidobacteria bacterium]|nr:hypothetical protein [Acidobacteriota bacterium]